MTVTVYINSLTMLSVLQQVYSTFQSKFSRECKQVLPLYNLSILFS